MAAEPSEHAGSTGKRVSYVELYLDLVFVLAVGRIALLIVEEPRMRSVWIALGLFAVLWWTWVAFAVLYSRTADAEGRSVRLLFLAASVPTGIAAVAIESVAEGHVTVFALGLAVVRVLIAGAHGDDRGGGSLLRLRIARAFMLSALLFAVSPLAPAPWFGVLWAVAIAVESGAMLQEDREAMRQARREHDFGVLLTSPADPDEAVDPHHFAERFALFVIILLGEVVVEAGQGGAESRLELGAAMTLAAGLWWLYFDAAADRNLQVLELSGGSPTMARAIYATGHMLPCFALLLLAAGVGLLLEAEDPPRLAAWLACVGLGLYLSGTKVFLRAGSRGGSAVRTLLLVATFMLARLRLGPEPYVVLLAAWTVGCAALTSVRSPPPRPLDPALPGGSRPPGSPSDPAPSDAARRR